MKATAFRLPAATRRRPPRRRGAACLPAFILLAMLVLSLSPLVGARRSAPEAAPPGEQVPARLHETTGVHVEVRGDPFARLSDGGDVLASFVGDATLVRALEQNEAKPLSLATADFDGDGVADLVSGYLSDARGGILVLQRGSADAIYPHSLEAQLHKSDRTFTDAPFLSPAHVVGVPEAPAFIGAGDFDADGDADVVMAPRGSATLYILAGDGHGGFKEAERMALPGGVTALAVGDINRRDGLEEIAVAVTTSDGPQALVFEGPEGAARATPEVYALPAEASGLAVGQLDDRQEVDLAVAAGRELVIIFGRDRKLSLNVKNRAGVAPAKVEKRAFPFVIRSVEIGDFTGQRKSDIALLSDDGEVIILSREGRGARSRPLSSWPEERLAGVGRRLLKARVSSSPADELLVLEQTRVRIITHTYREVEEEQNGRNLAVVEEGQRETATIEVEGEPVAVLGMRLNGDALDDLVLLTGGKSAPVVMMTAVGATITVNSNLDTNERDNKLTLREAILISNSELLVGSLTAAEQSQVVGPPGPLDRIEFNITATTGSAAPDRKTRLAVAQSASSSAGLLNDPWAFMSKAVYSKGEPLDIRGAVPAPVNADPTGWSQAGGLDPTFGSGGKVITTFSSFYAQVYATAIQTDGKIVAAGVSGNFNDNISGDFGLARYHTDGTLDSSFGTGGRVTTPIFASGSDIAYAVAVQPDGKIVAAGYARNSTSIQQFALARYNADGSLDTTFDTDGKVTANFSSGGVIHAIVIQPDGRIVVAGEIAPNIVPKDFVLARYNSNGSLDATFGTAGVVRTDFISDDFARALVLLPDGRLVAAGYTGRSVNFLFALARYNPDGSLDTTFGNRGKVVTDFAGASIDQAFALVRQPDGKLIAAGQVTNNGGNPQFALARYNLDGRLDVSFDGDGKVTTDFTAGSDIVYGLALQSDGRIVAAGRASNSGTGSDFALARYNCDGTLDTSFDSDGKTTTDFSGGGTDIAFALALQSDGRIVTGGYTSTNATLADFALARYDGATGTPCNGDCTYSINPASQIFTQSGGAGVINVTAGAGCNWTATSNAPWITITSGGSGAGNGVVNYSTPVNNGATRTGAITVAGLTFVVSQGGVGSPPGSLDSTFGSGGKVNTTFPNFYSQAYATAVQTDGKVIAVGVSGDHNSDNLSGDFALARYNADGSLDTSFGTGGSVTTPFFSTGTDIAYAVAIQSDGKIVAAGFATNSNSISQIGIARYHPNGTLDTTFDGDGKATSNLSAGGIARAVAIQPDGRIVVAGHEDTIFSDNDFILARFNSNGNLDTTFDTDGIVNTPFVSDDQARALVLLPDGRIVAAGYTGSFLTYVFALARYHPDGTLDNTFGNDGKLVTDFPGFSVDQANALVRQPDGKLIAAGFVSSNFGTISPGQFALARYNSDGTLDVSFNGTGRVTTDFTSGQDVAYALSLQSDGRVLAAGQANNTGTGLDFALARYNCDGTLDASFDSDGKVTSDFNSSTDIAFALALQSDGGIVTGGYSSTNTILSDFALIRYEGGGSAFTLNPTNRSFIASGGAGVVNVSSAGCNWTATSNAPWITITGGGSGAGNGVVNYTVDANGASVARTGTMTIAGQTFSVLQFGDATSCAVTPITIGQTINGALDGTDCFSPIRSTQAGGNHRADRYSFNGAVGQQVVLSLSSAQFDTYLYLLGTDGNLVAQDEDGGGGANSRIPAFSGNFILPASGAYTIEVTSSLPNATGGYTLDLSIGAATCSYSISPNSQSFASGGGADSVTVTTGASCSWTATSNAGFIQITSGESGSGIGTVNYTVAPNPDAARTGTLTIAGQTFTVSQAAGPGCSYSISPTNQTFTANGGGGTVSVSAAVGCSWTASSNSAFILVTAGASGSGGGTVSYTVAANTSGATRAGSLTVAGRTFTVVQGAAGSGITILLLSPLPKVTEPVVIDGTTQPGYTGAPIVEINGAAVGGGNGLEITAGSSTVRGLTLNRFASNNRVSAMVLITNGNNIVENCYVGSNAVGTGSFAPFGAGPIAAGITVRSSSNNRLGGTVSAARNLISGVDGSGIIISGGATGNLVQGNYIGTDATGSLSLGLQRIGVYMQGASGNIVGGVVSGSGNLISGNLDYGVYLQDDARNNLVIGNIIGANGAGTAAIPNGNAGVFIYDPTGLAASALGNAMTLDNSIGGTTAAARNLISGNDPYGIVLGEGATGTLVQGNYIGTSANGATALPNTYGVTATQATGSAIGGSTPAARNVISGNTLTGVSIGFLNNGQLGGTGTTIQNNYIGANANATGPLGNRGDGIFVEVQSITHTIQDNLIAFNGQSGVRIPNVTSNPGVPGVRIEIVDNSIYSNSGLGIDLGANGITANDPQDADTGANFLQNFPVLNSSAPTASLAVRDKGAAALGTVMVSGTLNSTPNSTFTIHWYFSDAQQCANNQPASRPLVFGKVEGVMTNASGDAQFSFPLTFPPGITSGVVNTTATDPVGNTSEYSACLPVVDGPPQTTVQFSAASYTATEAGRSVTVTVTRIGSTVGESFVQYATADGAATERKDYIAAIGRLRFAAGEISKTFEIIITDDRFDDDNESFTVTLSNPVGATLGAQSTATVSITDNDDANGPSPVKDASIEPPFFVRQHYADFLGRVPDQAGLNFWTDQATNCGASDPLVCRINVSAAFFLSIENQETGYLVHRAYKVAYGNLPNKPVPLLLREYLAGSRQIGEGVQVGVGNWQQQLEANKQAFFTEFVTTSRFTQRYPAGMDNGAFVDALNQNASGALSTAERNALVADLNTGARTRAAVVRAVAEDADFAQGAERNRAFVLAQYFGYLRRNPDDVDFRGVPDPNFDGYNFWLGKLNEFNGNFIQAEMVRAFIQSIEYGERFGQ